MLAKSIPQHSSQVIDASYTPFSHAARASVLLGRGKLIDFTRTLVSND